MQDDNMEIFQQARPIIRSVLAFISYIRFQPLQRSESYKDADYFLQQFEKDLKAQQDKAK